MATDVGDALPPLLMTRLGAGRAGMEGTAVPVCTVDPDGNPHPAMLSYGELAADGPRAMRAAVHAASRTARHLREQGRMTLLFVDAEATYYVKTKVASADAPHPASPGVAVFPLTVVAVLSDGADTSREPAAAITSGIRFTRAGAGTTL